MPTEGVQDASIAFLADAATHGGAPVERIETHGNLVFLAGDEAWKIKRAVRFAYMDFSTLARRHAACLAELEINRRFAPDLYIDCVALTREAGGHLAFAGGGEVVEWAVHMRRFAQEDLLSSRAAAGTLTDADAKAVADRIFSSHGDADVASGAAGHDRMRAVLDAVISTLSQASLDARVVSAWATAASASLDGCRELLDARARAGAVRRCHGDLHAANIVFWQGRPMLYDAIEFDPEIATVDTLYDLAFLLMDLGVRDAGRAANVILNRYLWRDRDARDLDGLAALPLFMSLRAAIRAMVTAERAAQQPQSRADDGARAQALLRQAQALLDASSPRLVAVAGLSGTGKSTLAADLAPELGRAPGAIHLRTDLERKALWGVEETERLPETAYTQDASRHVYAATLARAERALAAGASVLVDAVAARPHERAAMADLARRVGVRFDGLWLTGPEHVLAARVAARRGDASDATADVVQSQAAWDIGVLEKGWSAIDAGGSIAATHAAARQVLETPLRPPSP